jgi:hypothetical protein
MIKIKKVNKIKMIIKIMRCAMIKGGVEQDENKDDQHKLRSSPLPHPRVRQTVQCDHPVNNILGAIEKGVTTRSHVVTFL